MLSRLDKELELCARLDTIIPVGWTLRQTVEKGINTCLYSESEEERDNAVFDAQKTVNLLLEVLREALDYSREAEKEKRKQEATITAIKMAYLNLLMNHEHRDQATLVTLREQIATATGRDSRDIQDDYQWVANRIALKTDGFRTVWDGIKWLDKANNSTKGVS